MTLRESLENWAALRRGAVKPRTQHYHREIIETIVRLWPEKAGAETAEISESDLGAFVIRIDRFSASRFNGMVTMLKDVLPAAKKIKRRRVRLKKRAALSQLEFNRLLDQLDERPRSHAGLVIRFLAHTGLRINEARKLRWADVREDHILVPAEIVKNDQPKAVPFVKGVRVTLKKLREVTGENEHVIPQAECKRSLDTACRLAGLPHLSHHDFRHLFATRCIQSGVDLPTVARWLGHQDGGALLAKVYYHLIDEHSRRMAAKVVI
jgi:integrase